MNNLSETVRAAMDQWNIQDQCPSHSHPARAPGLGAGGLNRTVGRSAVYRQTICQARRAAASHRDELTTAVPDSSKTAGAVTCHLLGPARCSIALPDASSPTYAVACLVLTAHLKQGKIEAV